MDNLAIVERIVFNNGELTPCIRILRGIQLAARQQNAQFVIEMSFTYPSDGADVTTETIKVPIKQTKGMEGDPPDSMFCRVMAPAIPLSRKPDHGATWSCNATITITPVSGIVTPCSPIDTQRLRTSYGW